MENNNNITPIGTIATSGQTKTVQTLVKFKTGEQLQMGADVPKHLYASLQSKLSTGKSNLLAREYKKELTPEEVDAQWATRTSAWNTMVEPIVRKSLPEIIQPEIESIEPVGNLFVLRG